MSADNEKDFWSSSNDDFWSKPVVSDDWLKNDSSGDLWGNSESTQEKNEQKFDTVNPYSREEEITNPYSEKTDSYVEESNPFEEGNPYMQEAPDPFEAENPYIQKTYQTAEQVYAQMTGEKPAKKKEKNPSKKKAHVHTFICLFFLAITVASIVAAIVGVSAKTKAAVKQINNVNYTEEEVGDTFSYYDNNQVVLEDVAYTIVSQESFTGFPENQKLIALYVEVYSEDYEYENNAFRNCCIGYELEGATVYKTPAREDMVTPFIMAFGFQTEQILSVYGIGNGSDKAGYYFFLFLLM